MSRVEIASFVIGCIGLLCMRYNIDTSDATDRQTFMECMTVITMVIVFGLMVLLPIVFDFFRYGGTR